MENTSIHWKKLVKDKEWKNSTIKKPYRRNLDIIEVTIIRLKIKSNRYTLTEEKDVFAFLGVEVNADESTGKVTLPKKGLMQKL